MCPDRPRAWTKSLQTGRLTSSGNGTARLRALWSVWTVGVRISLGAFVVVVEDDSPEDGTSTPEPGHRGRDSLERFLPGWLESFDGFGVEPEQVVERGDELVVIVRQTGTGRSSGPQVETRLAHVWNRGERQSGPLGGCPRSRGGPGRWWLATRPTSPARASAARPLCEL
ncbi:MAG: nuclear transport factor 2 family protein, partial [Thermoleophilaceae bacterium]